MCPTRILSDLDDTEESIALNTEFTVDFSVNREGHGTSDLGEFFELLLESLITLTTVCLINAGVEDDPALASRTSLEVPVAEDVGRRFAVPQRIARRQ